MKEKIRNIDIEQAVVFLLKLSACCIFLARGWLYFNKMGSLSTFFWHSGWLSEVLYEMGIEWRSYTAVSWPIIYLSQELLGGVFFICALAVWWVRPKVFWVNGIVMAGTLFLAVHWLLRWVATGYQFPMFIELFLQWGTPLLLLLYKRIPDRMWGVITGLFISLTFIGHGLYALGWGVPRPHTFVTMVMKLIGLGESGSVIFLMIHGILDLLLPLTLLFPYRIKIIGLFYGFVWGLAIALARVIVHVTPAEKYYGLHPWLAESVVRFAHGLVPLALLLWLVVIHQRKKMPEE